MSCAVIEPPQPLRGTFQAEVIANGQEVVHVRLADFKYLPFDSRTISKPLPRRPPGFRYASPATLELDGPDSNGPPGPEPGGPLRRGGTPSSTF
jgi:hypothetical protein